MSFRIAASPTRRKRSTSGLQTIKLNRSHSISTTVELVDEIKQLMYALSPNQQTLVR